MKKMTFVGLVLILTSCNFPAPGWEAERDLAGGVEPTFTPMPGHEAAAGNAPLTPPAGMQECAWKWNSQSLPELTAELQAALADAGLGESIGKASAFGEDCFDPETEKVSYFAVKQTDFMLTLPEEEISDLEALGGHLERALMVLELFPSDSTPGPMAGKVTIIFDAGGNQERFSFNQDEGTTALKSSLSGAALLEALGYQP